MARRFQTLILVSGYLAASAYSQLLPDTAPDKTQDGQVGTNKCGTQSSQTSMCQNAFLNSVDDFCLYAPINPGPGSVIGNTEREEVSWCTKGGRGTRLIPDGALTGVHFIQTPDFVQITGVGDLTLLNIPKGDAGGELDPHGADGNGNPVGGLVFSSAFGNLEQIHEWTNFMSDTEFCFRACKPGPRAAQLCQHIYDVMGCAWNMPGNYGSGFDSCKADSGEPMGVYGSSTFFQGQPVTPPAHPAPATSSCVATSTIGNGVVVATSTSTTTPGSAAAASQSSQVVVSESSTVRLSSIQVALTSSSSIKIGSTPSRPGVSTSTSTSTSAGAASNTASGARGLYDEKNKLVMTIGSTLTLGMVSTFFLF